MIFTPDARVYVSYSTDIMQPVVELLTISKYKNNLLYFKEKSSYYAVECHNASFYGYSSTMAGKIFVTKYRWQLPFAAIAEKMRFIIPVNHAKAVKEPAFKLRLSKVS